jgi:2-polyprenyl-6-methoxyphenol hydroxylase-like FAD-dependent oxidoreductase
MQRLFPTLAEDLQALNVPEIDLTGDGGILTVGGWTRRFKSGITSHAASRITLEWVIRQQVKTRSNVTFIEQTEIKQLMVAEDKQTIIGVEIESRADHSTDTLKADLVVDASGRGSKAPDWLQALGYDAPSETVVNSYLGYATRWYEIPSDRAYDWDYFLVGSRPAEGVLRGGGIMRMEGNRWAVTLVGVNKDYPPTDEAEFLEFARSLISPAIYEAITDATPISPIYGYRRTENRWHHYEKLPRLPERFVVMGDAYCGFNPVYGQGMTVAALEALKLDDLLRQGDISGDFPARFYAALAKTIETPWLLATGEDLRYAGTDGDRPGPLARMIQKYTDRITMLLPYDEQVSATFISVTNLLNPPTVLFQPQIVGRVLWHSLFRKPRNDQLNAPVIPPVQARQAVGD